MRPRQDAFLISGGPSHATRRLQTQGLPSCYTHAPPGRARRALRNCEETGQRASSEHVGLDVHKDGIDIVVAEVGR